MESAVEALGSVELNLELRHAASKGETEKVKSLLKAGAKIHANYDAALRDAAYWGHTETVKVLLEEKADPYTLNASPLRLAEKNKHQETAKVLMDAMDSGRTPQPWPSEREV